MLRVSPLTVSSQIQFPLRLFSSPTFSQIQGGQRLAFLKIMDSGANFFWVKRLFAHQNIAHEKIVSHTFAHPKYLKATLSKTFQSVYAQNSTFV